MSSHPWVDQSDPNSPDYRAPLDFSSLGGPTSTGKGGHDGVYSDSGYDFLDIPIYDEFTGELISYDPQLLGRTSGGSGSGVNDALTAASQAISAFLTGQSLADARKLGAAEQFQNLAAFALPEGTLPPGFEKGGAMHQLAARKGRNYTPPPMQYRTVNPAALEQPGQVSPEIMGFIDQILGAGGL